MARSAYREAAELLRASPQGPPTFAAATRHPRAGHRPPTRPALGAPPARRFWAHPSRLREAEALAEALDDPRRLAQVSVFLSNHFSLLGAYDQAITAAQRALALATANGDIILPPLANYYLGLAYPSPGRLSSGDRLPRANRGVP